MKLTLAKLYAVLVVLTLALAAGCSGPTEDKPFQITQAQLDSATIVLDKDITGDPHNAFPKDDVATRENKIRDLVSSIAKDATIAVGSVFVRRAYKYENGKRGELINAVIMVKREAGYYPEGADYEYMNIAYDANTDYTKHPNGMLPPVTDTDRRGKGEKLKGCVTCHSVAASGEDRLFVR